MGVGGTQKGLWLHRRTAGSSQGSVQQVREEVSRILPGRRRQWPRGDSWGGAGPTSLTRVSLSVALRPRWQVTAPPSSSPAFLLPAALPSLRDDCGLGLAMNAERIFLQLMPFRRLWPLLCKINAKTLFTLFYCFQSRHENRLSVLMGSWVSTRLSALSSLSPQPPRGAAPASWWLQVLVGQESGSCQQSVWSASHAPPL